MYILHWLLKGRRLNRINVLKFSYSAFSTTAHQLSLS